MDWVLKYLVLSDIHANIEALDAVLHAAGSYDHALVLGDLVGYGADPNAVIDRLRALPAATFIRGNHDKVGAGLENTDGFNYLARNAISWTAHTLTPDHVGALHAAQIDIPRDDHSRFLVNCGAVGQPRDGDPRAAYGIIDTEARTLSLQRVEYDVAAAQARILAAGLPDVLAQRLAVGR